MKKEILKNSIANLISNKAFIRTYRPIINHMRSSYGCVIVNFHQFYNKENGFVKKGPSVHTHIDDFGEFIDILKQRFEPISMDILAKHLHSKKSLENDSFLITMDDGYENNLTLGAPILKKSQIRATLYIATGFIGTNKLLPMDMIDYALRQTQKVRFEWNYIKGETLEIDTIEKRQIINNRIGEIIKYLPTYKLSNALSKLYESLDVDMLFSSNNMLDWNQVKHLLDYDIDIGSHGVSHTCMTTLKEEEATNEIHISKKEIIKNTGYNPIHFAFPNGTEKDFNDTLRNEAIRAGYKTIASVTRGINIPGITNPYNINRVGMIGSPSRSLLYIEKMFLKTQRKIKKKNI